MNRGEKKVTEIYKQQIIITPENIDSLAKHGVKSIAQLQSSLTLLKHDLSHKKENMKRGAIVMTIYICKAVEEALKAAADELAKEPE